MTNTTWDTQLDALAELSDRDLEAIAAGKGLGGPIVEDYHFGGLSPVGKMWARFLDNRSIRLVSA